MKSREHHLAEERLFDCYLTAQNGEPVDPPVAEHLLDCAPCSERYADLARFMDMLNADAAAASDAVFTPERLRAQRQQIARKLEHLGYPARVITFPGHAVHPHAGSSVPRSARRWIAAAAAAGLFIGVGTGLLLDWERAPGRGPSGIVARRTVLTTPTASVPGEIDLTRYDRSADDKAFLSELELAGERPRIRELSAVDALTPHVREVNLR